MLGGLFTVEFFSAVGLLVVRARRVVSVSVSCWVVRCMGGALLA